MLLLSTLVSCRLSFSYLSCLSGRAICALGHWSLEEDRLGAEEEKSEEAKDPSKAARKGC